MCSRSVTSPRCADAYARPPIRPPTTAALVRGHGGAQASDAQASDAQASDAQAWKRPLTRPRALSRRPQDRTATLEVLLRPRQSGGETVAPQLDFQEFFHGNTPMHLAAKEGQTEVVVGLIQVGANPSIRNFAGRTPIEEARAAGAASTEMASTVSPSRQARSIVVYRSAV